MKEFWRVFPQVFFENFTEVRNMFETQFPRSKHMLESLKARDKDESTSLEPKCHKTSNAESKKKTTA